MYDVLIIGAGVVGTAIARRLSRYQLKIAIVEAENDVSMGSSKGLCRSQREAERPGLLPGPAPVRPARQRTELRVP